MGVSAEGNNCARVQACFWWIFEVQLKLYVFHVTPSVQQKIVSILPRYLNDAALKKLLHYHTFKLWKRL